MKNWQTIFLRWMQYSLEMICLYVLMFPFLINEGEGISPYLAFLAVVISAALIYTVALRKLGSINLAAFLAPIIVIIAGLAGYHLFVALLLAVVLLWRVTSLIDEYNQEKEEYLFAV